MSPLSAQVSFYARRETVQCWHASTNVLQHTTALPDKIFLRQCNLLHTQQMLYSGITCLHLELPCWAVAFTAHTM